jgi:hypothetical protein
VAGGTVSSTISKLDFHVLIKKQGISHNIVISKISHNTIQSREKKQRIFFISGLLIPGFVIERGKIDFINI